MVAMAWTAGKHGLVSLKEISFVFVLEFEFLYVFVFDGLEP